MKPDLKRTLVLRLLCLAGFAAAGHAYSQSHPDTSQTLLQQAPALRVPRATPDIRMDIDAPAGVPAGGPQVTVWSVSFKGATVFTEAELLALLGDVKGRSFDLAGLRGLADRISTHYRVGGYPFASAVIPVQTMAAGALRIDVIEGRYGRVQTTGDAALAARAQVFLAELKPGRVIDVDSLERAVLLLDDLPGLRVSPVIYPGQTVGTGDLDVVVERDVLYRGSVSLDNHGNRYTGRGRASAALDVDSAFMLGDQISTRLQRTGHSQWFGHLGYSRPFGGSGLRAEIVAARMAYTLGKEFAALGASGTAAVASLGVSYPLLRSQKANLGLALGWQYRALHDQQSQAGSPTDKTSRSLPITLTFDWRDGLGAGGVNYGSVTHTVGMLRMDSVAAAMDATTAGSAGAFSKTSLAIARLQALTPAWSLQGKVSVQWSRKNLDSSEKLSLGGAAGVRAAASGEASGDRGWLAQWELRYAQGALRPYLFVDAGQITTNARPWLQAARKERRSGAGIGSRYSRGAFFCDATLAWRDTDNANMTDSHAGTMQTWVSLGTSF